jgi:O-antigen ligase
MLVIATIRLQRNVFSKMVVYSFLFILFLGIMATRSRAGLMALAGGLLLMAFWGRSKKVAWLMIVAALVVVFSFGTMKEQYAERIRKAYDPSTGIVGVSVAGRFRTWASYFETATPGIYIFGQGFRQGMERNGMESHNVYVSLITVYGIGGVIWAVFALTYFVRKIIRLRHAPDPLISTVSAGAMWALIVWGIFGMTADVLNSSYARYLLFYLVVIVDRAYYISQEQQEWFFYEESDNLGLQTVNMGIY